MSAATPSQNRDLTLQDVASRLTWTDIVKLLTGLITLLGVVLSVTIWILQNTHQAQLDRKEGEIEKLTGKLETADKARSELADQVVKLTVATKTNDLKNKFLSLCMRYYSATERHKESEKATTQTLLTKMYEAMYDKGIPDMERDGFVIQKVPQQGGGLPVGKITFKGDSNEYLVPMGVKGELMRFLERP